MSSNNMEALERRLDQIIDAINDEQPPVIDSAGEPELVELLDAVLLVRQLRESAWPDDDFPDEMAGTLAVSLADPDIVGEQIADNGQLPVTRLPARTRPGRFRTFLWAAAMLVRSLSIVIVAGMLSALVAGGIGGRLAMRASGYMWHREHPGGRTTTESSGQLVGNITLAGSLDLILQVTIFFGIPGGIAYLIFKPLFQRFGRFAGVLFGLVLLAVAGVTVISSDNRDFSRLGSPLLNVIMFGMIFVAFGLLIVPISRRLDRRFPTTMPGRPIRVRSLGVYAVMLIFGGIGLLVLVESSILAVIEASMMAAGAVSGGGQRIDVLLPVVLFGIYALLLFRVLISPTGSELVICLGGSQSTLARLIYNRRTSQVVVAILALLAFAGLVITLRAALAILT